MASNSIYEGALASDVQDGRTGINCERSLRLLVFLLDGWSRFATSDKATGQLRSLTAIPFDKFAMLVFRLWDSAYKLDRGVTFPPPFQEIPGKHGRGPGRYEGPNKRPPIYLIDILFQLQTEGLLHYFRITPPKNDPTNPKNPKTTVLPAVPIPDTNDFLKGFTDSEKKILMGLQSTIKRLEPPEVRALGTHCTHQKTIKDIRREFDYIQRSKQKVIDALRQGDHFANLARQLSEFADEAWRKSALNADSYSSAYKAALREMTDSDLREAFEKCQNPTERIWDNSQVLEELRNRAARTRSFTRYLYAVARYQQKNKAVPDKRMARSSKLWDRAVAGLTESNFVDFPRTLQAAFVKNTNEIEPTVRERLIQVLESL